MEKVKNVAIKIGKNYTVLFTVYLFAIEILFKILTGTFEWNYSLLRIFISSCIISGCLNLLVEFIKNDKVKKAVLIFFSLLVGIYALAQLGFNNFLGNYASLNTSSQLGKVTSYIMDYLHSFKNTYYLILLPTMAIILYVIFV